MDANNEAEQAIDFGEELETLNNKYLRALADRANLDKRMRLEVEKAYERGKEDAFRAMLSIVDDLERGNDAAQSAKGRGTLSKIREGFRMVTEKARVTLGHAHIEAFDSREKDFDPQRMEAIAQTPTLELPPGKVFGELERGYTRQGRLLRPAKVAVSIAPKGAVHD